MSRPAEPQALLSPITEAAIFLTVVLEDGQEDGIPDLLSEVTGLKRSVGFRLPEGELSCVVGIGAPAWDRLFGEPRPAKLHPFRELAGDRHTAPASAGDLLFHIRAHRMDLCFELAKRLTARLAGLGRVVDEVHTRPPRPSRRAFCFGSHRPLQRALPRCYRVHRPICPDRPRTWT